MNSENEFFKYSEIYHQDSSYNSEKPTFSPIEKSPHSNHTETGTLLPYGNCMVDHSGRQFMCFHDQCTEHENCFKKEAQEGITDFQALQLHPDDHALLCEKVFPDILKFMLEIPADERPGYRLSFNHRYIRKDGTVLQFLQEGTLSISDDGDLPVLNLRLFTEIADFKTDETMILSIFRYNADHGYQKVWTNMYSNNNIPLLSHREIEIIKLCLEGLSSKMIANKLNLSIHTVKNHKRNCMEKTLTHNITELIHLCMKSNLL